MTVSTTDIPVLHSAELAHLYPQDVFPLSPRVDFTVMAVIRGIPALRSLETITGFLKQVELCKGLIVLPCLASSLEVYGFGRLLKDG